MSLVRIGWLPNELIRNSAAFGLANDGMPVGLLLVRGKRYMEPSQSLAAGEMSGHSDIELLQ